MNILLINHYAGSVHHGREFRPYYMGKEWVKLGHNVTIICSDYSHLRLKNPKINFDLQEEIIDGITYCWLKGNKYKNNGIKRAFSMFLFVSKLFFYSKKLINRYKPDVVISSSTYPLDAFAGRYLSKLSGAKFIHEVHDMWPATLYEIGGMSKYNPFVVLMQLAENYAYRQCDELVSLMPYTRDYMVKHGLQEQKFHNIQNGIVEEEWLNPKQLPQEHLDFFELYKNKFIVGYFGGFSVSNALDNLLDVAKKQNDKEILFVLVGNGTEKNRLIQRTQNEKISNVYFLPAVEKQCIPNLLKRLSCIAIIQAYSSLYRFGVCLNKMYDSMMSAKPIICSISAPNTLVEEYKCGISLKTQDVEEINKAILKIKNMSDNERRQMGENGRKAVLEHFTYRKLAKQFLEIMEETVK